MVFKGLIEPVILEPEPDKIPITFFTSLLEKTKNLSSVHTALWGKVGPVWTSIGEWSVIRWCWQFVKQTGWTFRSGARRKASVPARNAVSEPNLERSAAHPVYCCNDLWWDCFHKTDDAPKFVPLGKIKMCLFLRGRCLLCTLILQTCSKGPTVTQRYKLIYLEPLPTLTFFLFPKQFSLSSSPHCLSLPHFFLHQP